MDNNEMLEVYLFEANSLLEELDEILINCEKLNCFDTDSINTIFRIMHTIKGSSAMMEFNSIATVSHKIEDLFAFVRDHGINAGHNSELFELMFKSEDFLKAEISCVESNTPLTDNIGNFADEIIHFLKKISDDDEKAENEGEKQSLEGDDSADTSFTHVAKIFFDEDAQMENLRAFMLLNAMSDLNCDYCYIPENLDSGSAAEEISQNGFVIFFKSYEDLEKSMKSIEQFSFVKQIDLVHEDTNQQDNVEEDKQQQSKGKLESGQGKNNQHSTTSLINVNLLKLDKLMDLMGEIVITESMVISIPTEQGVDMDSFSKASRQLQKLIDELQEDIMSIRMVPVNSVFQKMRRIVRDISKKLDKDVDLILEGEDTEVDKTIVDGIGDPLMHLVRNAMDHGIESPAENRQKGRLHCPRKIPAAKSSYPSATTAGATINRRS
jgi:two-component system chemotaxis sensor kinase CheA